MNLIRKLLGRKPRHDYSASLMVTPGMSSIIQTTPECYWRTHYTNCALMRTYAQEKADACNCEQLFYVASK